MRTNTEGERIDLIEDIAQGNQAALAQFYDLTSSHVFGLVLRMVGKKPAAEEITLDVFTSVWRRAGQYRARDGSASAWVLNMARRRSMDWLRSGACPLRNGDATFAAEVVEQPAAKHEDGSTAKYRQAIQEALAAIHPQQRAALELAYFRGMSCSEIADNLAEPVSRVRDSIRVAMVALRQALCERDRYFRVNRS